MCSCQRTGRTAATKLFTPCCFASVKSFFRKWWAWLDSNRWPCAYQAHALTNWATRPTKLVELRRVELLTYSLQSYRSTNWATAPSWIRVPICDFEFKIRNQTFVDPQLNRSSILFTFCSKSVVALQKLNCAIRFEPIRFLRSVRPRKSSFNPRPVVSP